MTIQQAGSKAASVEFRNVTKIYGKDVVAVDDVSLHVHAGELVWRWRLKAR